MKLLLFLLLIFPIQLLSTQLFITDLNTNEYPINELNYYFVDTTLNSIDDNILKENLILSEDGDFANIISHTNAIKPKTINSSLLFSLDVSGSMQGEKLNNARLLIKNIINLLDDTLDEIGLNTFNNGTFLNSIFTNDFVQIENKLDLINTSGASNLNNLFNNSRLGLFTIMEYATFEKNIIIITDSDDLTEKNEIIVRAKNENIRISIIDLNNYSNKALENLAKSTGGLYINNYDNKTASILSYSIMKHSKPSILRFNTNKCSINRNYTLIFNNKHFIDYSYSYIDEKLPNLLINPSDVLEFGQVDIGKTIKKSITVTAENGDIYIDTVYADCDMFKTYFNGNFLLTKGNQKVFEVEYNAFDENYHICKLIIEKQSCEDEELILTGGKRKPNSNTNTLQIANPEMNEVLIGNSLDSILWTGILPSDEVIIDFRADENSDWDTIANNVNGLKYENYLIENINSNKAQLRVTQKYLDEKLSNVIYLDDIGHDDIIFDWKSNTNYLVYVDNNLDFKTWDYKNKNIITQFSNSQKVSNLKCNPKSSLFAFTLDNNNNELFALNAKSDAENQINFGKHDDKINSIDWNYNGTLLAAGIADGNVKIWNQFDPDFKPNSATITKEFNNSIQIVDWSNGEFEDIVAVIDTVNYLYLYEINNNITSTFSIGISANKIIDFKWNNTGSKLLYSDGNYLRTAELIRDETQNDELRVINRTIIKQNIDSYISANWSKNSTKIILSTADSLMILNASDGSIISNYRGHNEVIKFSDSENDLVASSSRNEEIQIWHIDSLHQIGILQSDTVNLKIEKLKLNLSDIDLGTHCTGFDFDTTYFSAIINNNSQIIVIDSIVVDNDDFDEISILNQFPININPSQSLELKLNINPKTIENTDIDLLIHSYGQIKKITINRNFIKPILEINVNNLDFNSVNIGQESSPQTVSITNNSNNDITIFTKDYFNFENNFKVEGLEDETKISANSSLDFKVIFTPNDLVLSNAMLIITSSDICTPLQINMVGNGVAPQIAGKKMFYYGTIICEDENILNFEIDNQGDGVLNINEISSISGNLSYSSNTFSINPNQKKEVEIEFNKDIAGSYNEFVVVKSNINQDYSTSNTFILKFEKEISDFSLSSDSLIYLDLDEGTPYEKQFELRNNGSIDLSFTKSVLSDFQVVKIEPEIIKPNQTSKITVKFNGGNEGEVFLDSLLFSDDCNYIQKLYLKANIDARGPILSSMSKNIIFKKVICQNESIDTLVTFTNIGNKPLIISDIIGSSNFEAINTSDIINKEYLKNESFQLEISFNSDIFGKINDNIILKTNEESQKDYIIELEAERDFIELKFTYDDPKDEIIYQKSNFNSFIQISEYGNLDYQINGFKNSINFIIDSVTYDKTLNDSLVYYSFINGEPETQYNDTLLISTPCGDIELPLEIFVRGNNFIVLKTNDIDVDTYEVFNIKLNVENPNNLDIGSPKTIVGNLKINLTSAVVLSNEYKDNTFKQDSSLLIPFNVKINKFKGIIEEIKFRATRGNTSISEISIEEPSFENFENYYIITESSEMKINIPDSGFVIGKDSVYLNYIFPNPADQKITINFGLIEKGNYSVRVYDFNGNMVDVVRSGNLSLEELNEQNSFLIEYDTRKLAIGYYQVRLKTASNIYIKKFLIQR